MVNFFYFIPTTPSSTSFPLGICLFLHVWSILFPPHWLSVDKGKERLQWFPNTVLCPMWVCSSHMRDHFPKFAWDSTRTDENSYHVWEQFSCTKPGNKLTSCASKNRLRHARGHSRVSRFAQQTTEKRETVRSLQQELPVTLLS